MSLQKHHVWTGHQTKEDKLMAAILSRQKNPRHRDGQPLASKSILNRCFNELFQKGYLMSLKCQTWTNRTLSDGDYTSFREIIGSSAAGEAQDSKATATVRQFTMRCFLTNIVLFRFCSQITQLFDKRLYSEVFPIVSSTSSVFPSHLSAGPWCDRPAEQEITQTDLFFFLQ